MNIGLDLGSTTSQISYINAQGIPALFPDRNEPNFFYTPSLVSINDGQAYIGRSAIDNFDRAIKNSMAQLFKSSISDPNYYWSDSENRQWPASALMGMIIRKLLLDAKVFSPEPIESAVIAVPAQFNDVQRKGMLDAALMGGLDNPTLLEEPVAAVMFHENCLDKEQTVLVYDLGGGMFDASIVQVEPDGLFVLATAGLPRMGGRTFDQRIRQILLEQLKGDGALHAAQVAEKDPYLWKIAEEIKIELGQTFEGRISKTKIIGGYPLEITITGRQFEHAIRHDIAQTIDKCRECLEAASLGWADIDRVLLVGGSSIIPYIKKYISEETRKPSGQIVLEHPEQAVAFGTAIRASRLCDESPENGPKLKQGCASQTLGLMIREPRADKVKFLPLIHRNTPLPASVTRTFFTNRSRQTRIVLELAQKQSESSPPTSLGHFIFDGIVNPRKNYPVEVTLNYNIDGTIIAKAKDNLSGTELDHTVTDPTQSEKAGIMEWRKLSGELSINEF
jgi:molecular chaperone DnaK